jgi:hypothetical protein
MSSFQTQQEVFIDLLGKNWTLKSENYHHLTWLAIKPKKADLEKLSGNYYTKLQELAAAAGQHGIAARYFGSEFRIPIYGENPTEYYENRVKLSELLTKRGLSTNPQWQDFFSLLEVKNPSPETPTTCVSDVQLTKTVKLGEAKYDEVNDRCFISKPIVMKSGGATLLRQLRDLGAVVDDHVRDQTGKERNLWVIKMDPTNRDKAKAAIENFFQH